MKKLKVNDYLTILLEFLLAILCSWYVLDSLLLAIVYGIVVVLGIIYIKRQAIKRDKLFHDIDSAYSFVNLMNIQMLTTNSIYEAYKSIENYIDVDFANIDNEDLHTQLLEIANDYNLNSFKMYINTLLIYDNDGGDYKKMQQIPTSLCQKTKVYYHKLSKNKMFKLLEITSLFVMWLFILFFLKIAIPNYYGEMMGNMVYQFIMLGLLLCGSFFYYLSFMEYLNNKIRGL